MAVYCSRVRVGEPLLEEAGTPLLAVTLGGLHGSPGTEAPCLFRVLSLCWGPCPVVRWRHRHWPSTAHGGRAADGRACPSWVTTAGASRLWPCTLALGWGWPRCLGPTRSHRREGWADGLVKRGTHGCLPVAAASWRLRARGRLVCGTRAPATPATCRAAAAPRRRPRSAAPPQRWRRPTPCAARRPRGVRLSGPDGARRPRRRPVQPRPVVLGAPVGVDARGRQAPARRGRPSSRRQRPASGAGSAAVTGCAPLARRALWARPGCGRRPPCTTTPTRLTKSKSKRQERPQLWEKTTVQRCTMTRAHASRGTR